MYILHVAIIINYFVQLENDMIYLLVLFMMFIYFPFELFSQDFFDINLSKAKMHLIAGDTSQAKELLTLSIKEYKNPEAYFQMALILKSQNKSDNKLQANNYFKEAIEKEPLNIEFRFEYAKYLEYLDKIERTDLFSLKLAIDQYNEIIKIDPNYSPAYYRLGNLKYKEYLELNRSYIKSDKTTVLQYTNFSSQSRNQILQQQWEEQFNPSLSFELQAKREFNASERYFKKAIETDPGNYDAYYTLGLLYEDADENEKGIETVSTLIKKQPGESNSQLLLGILFYKVNEIEQSHKAFQKAISLMTPEDQKDFKFNTVRLLISALIEEKKEIITEKDILEIVNGHWLNKDPLLLTSYNERLLEHYARVAYSNLHFGVEWKNLKGWQTDRGEILIRYGIPLKRMKLKGWTESEPLGAIVKPIQKINVNTEIWIYSDFTLAFIDPFLNGEYKFNVPDLGDLYNVQFAGDTDLLVKGGLRKSKPEEFIPKFKGPVFDLPYNTVQFRNEKNHLMTDVYVNYQLYVPDEINDKINANNKFVTGLFYHDGNFKEKISKVDTINLENSKIGSWMFTSQSEIGNLALEVIRKADEGVASYHGKLRVKDYGNNDLTMSDILLAGSLDYEKRDVGINRKGKTLEANPGRVFEKNDPVYIYYEVYNLRYDEKRITDFDQQLTIKRVGEETVLNKLMDVVGLGSEGEKITLTSNYKTLERDSQVYFQLDLSNYASGEYELEIKIKDNIAGKETNAITRITWVNN